MRSRHSLGKLGGISGANITPLADVTTTLIVVFLVTLPSLLWSGIEVQSKPANRGSQHVVTPSNKKKVGLLTVGVNPDGVTVNEEPVPIGELEGELTRRLHVRKNRTVVVVPDDRVRLGEVVTVLDIAKASGASSLALLNWTEDRR